MDILRDGVLRDNGRLDGFKLSQVSRSAAWRLFEIRANSFDGVCVADWPRDRRDDYGWNPGPALLAECFREYSWPILSSCGASHEDILKP